MKTIEEKIKSGMYINGTEFTDGGILGDNKDIFATQSVSTDTLKERTRILGILEEEIVDWYDIRRAEINRQGKVSYVTYASIKALENLKKLIEK